MDTHKRNFSLDALRGVAILLVLARHMPVEPTAGVSRAAFELGWTGVDLFFVLSGYLISTLLYKELDRAGALDLKRFWLRRGLKIWPSYFVCFGLTTVITAALSLSAGDAAVARKTLLTALPNVVFVQNYVGYQWPHTWSLAIEEHFRESVRDVIRLRRGCVLRRACRMAGGFAGTRAAVAASVRADVDLLPHR
jgi:peptidoglycan/LPS O-acetylase OafA/YrhL